MGSDTKPYLKCEKRDGKMYLTLMAGGGRSHSLVGRSFVPLHDQPAFEAKVMELIEAARAGEPILEK